MTDPTAEGTCLITCVVQRGRADKIVKAAIDAGAGGATVFFARGMGVRERLGLLGLAIVPEKEVIMIAAPEDRVDRIYDTMVRAGRLEDPGTGIIYITPIRRCLGLIQDPARAD